MAYVIADDLEDAKRRIKIIVDNANKKIGVSVKATSIGQTRHANLFYYLLVRDEDNINKDKGRFHAQKFVKFMNKKEFGDL